LGLVYPVSYLVDYHSSNLLFVAAFFWDSVRAERVLSVVRKEILLTVFWQEKRND